MKITEFNDIYKDCFPVSEGWRDLITTLVNDIISIDKEVIITQIKEKHGSLRFYIYGGNDEVYKLIDQAEEDSYNICELCGSTEDVIQYGGWIKTHCKKCREKNER